MRLRTKRELIEQFLEAKAKQDNANKEVTELGNEILKELPHGRYRVGDKLILVTITQGMLGGEARIDVIEIPEDMK